MKKDFENSFEISDFLILNLAKEIEENMTVVQGTATFIPMVATLLAMKSKKINLIGGFISNPKMIAKMPSTFCFKNYSKGESYLGLSGFLDILQTNKLDLEFLRPAQVDKFGNMNNTVIGDYSNPKIRLPGGMGLDDVMTFAKNIILYVPNHNLKTFVKKVDFITASGWDKGNGPKKIITNLCIFEFINKEIILTKINPFSTIEDIKKNTEFEFKISKNIEKMPLVNSSLKKIINKLDPLKLRNLEIKDKRESVLNYFN